MSKFLAFPLFALSFALFWLGNSLCSHSPSVSNTRLMPDEDIRKAKDAQRAKEEKAKIHEAKANKAVQGGQLKQAQLQEAKNQEAKTNMAIQEAGEALTASIQKHIDDLQKQADDAKKNIEESKKYVIELEKRRQEAIRQIRLKYGKPYILDAEGNEVHDGNTRP
jgi:chromosome segregation ATPase